VKWRWGLEALNLCELDMSKVTCIVVQSFIIAAQKKYFAMLTCPIHVIRASPNVSGLPQISCYSPFLRTTHYGHRAQVALSYVSLIFEKIFSRQTILMLIPTKKTRYVKIVALLLLTQKLLSLYNILYPIHGFGS